MKKIFTALKNGATTLSGVLAFFIPNAGRDAVITGLVWGAYWVVRFVREMFKAQWSLQRELGVLGHRLLWGLAFDITWSTIANDRTKSAEWWLNWVPVVYPLVPTFPFKVGLIALTTLEFYNAVRIREGKSPIKWGVSKLLEHLKP